MFQKTKSNRAPDMPEQNQPKRKPAQLNKADFQILRQAEEVERRIEAMEIAQPQQVKAENVVVGEIKPAKAIGRLGKLSPQLERNQKIKSISDAEKADIEVNRILIHRLMQAILSDEEKAA